MADATLPTSASDATIVGSSFLAGFNTGAAVTPTIAWRAGVELAGRGSTLSVPIVARAAIADYDPAVGIVFTDVDDDAVDVLMNQYKSWGKVQDLTAANAGAGNYLDLIPEGAGNDIAKLEDAYALAAMSAAAVTAGAEIGTALAPVDLTGAGAFFNLIADGATLLAETGPKVTAYVSTYALNQGLRDTRVVAPGAAESHGGRITNLIGVTIVETNQLPAGKVVFCSDPNAVVGGTSLNAIDTTFQPGPHKRSVSGITVFGCSVIKPECVAVAYVE
jgi:hypothetical protein